MFSVSLFSQSLAKLMIQIYMANISQKITKVQEKVNSIYKQIDDLQRQAKANLKKSQESKGSAKQMYKQRCLIALKKKKQLEAQAKTYNSHQNMLQQAVFVGENISGQKEMYDTLKGAVESQKAAMKGFDIDKMDELQDEMLDLKMQGDLMNQMLNRNYDLNYDSDQFEDQFMEFQKEVATQKKKAVIPLKKQENNHEGDVPSYVD